MTDTNVAHKPIVLRVPFISEYGEDYVPMALERRCGVCQPAQLPFRCPACGGTGFVLTDTGRAILRLVARHGAQS